MSGTRFFLPGVKLTWSKHWLEKTLEWMVDLVIVFVGVYAAFVLNAYESRQEQRDRRDQLLTWLDDYCNESATNLQNEKTLIEEAIVDFNSRLDKGEMPELEYVNISSSYDPSFTLSFFQAGAGELLDVGTLRQLRAVDKDSKLVYCLLVNCEFFRGPEGCLPRPLNFGQHGRPVRPPHVALGRQVVPGQVLVDRLH